MRTLYGAVVDERPGREEGHRYAIVLAGGDGKRLAAVARELYGYARPKQFCRLYSEHTLLEETLSRAERFTGSASRIVVSTSRKHRPEVEESLVGWPEVVNAEQPRNRDTTPGIALALLHILARDPAATVLVLPSDHHVSNDAAFVDSLTLPLRQLERTRSGMVLLAGATLSSAEPGLGWIVPGARDGSWWNVGAFVEKPDATAAEALRRSGAYANTFAFVARASALARLLRTCTPRWWSALVGSFRDAARLEQVYDVLPPSSFSREVLEAAPSRLCVTPLVGTVWSDVGTPERLEAVRRERLAPAACVA